MTSAENRTTVVDVEGMTCGHCVEAVTRELEAVSGVTAVSVQLEAGGVSPVTVITDAPVDDGELRAAVDEAGYRVAGVRH
ncbi:heavy-metal-associated domain-containing protein [Georgenia deserti]|uniref:Heavy-metal-associated domain-containing protein n=1 Tax=Georgenia deserti TaxID=2093781 RepID=A0ABW4L6Q5_9MICO